MKSSRVILFMVPLYGSLPFVADQMRVCVSVCHNVKSLHAIWMSWHIGECEMQERWVFLYYSCLQQDVLLDILKQAFIFILFDHI